MPEKHDTGRSLKRKASGPAIEPDNQKETRAAPTLNDPQPFVTVHVIAVKPNKKKSFPIHKNYICYYSSFFEAAFNGSFTEGKSQELDLHDTEPAIFGVFVNWLYSQKIVIGDGSRPGFTELVRLWVLADKLLIPRLQNQALVALDEARRLSAHSWIGSHILHYIYDNTNEGAPLRNYFIDMHSHNVNICIQNPGNYPYEFLVDLVGSMRTELKELVGRRRKWTPSLEISRYNVNEEVEAGNTRQKLNGSHNASSQLGIDSPDQTLVHSSHMDVHPSATQP